VSVVVQCRDDHYPVCRLDTRQDSEFATGYGYPKIAFKRKPDADPNIRNAFIDISRIQTRCVRTLLFFTAHPVLFGKF